MTAKHPLLVLAAALAVLPFACRAIGFTDAIATEIALFVMVGLGFNLLLGYTGLLSFGHGLFFGFAAYAAALAQIHWFKHGFFAPIVFAVTVTTLLGVAVGFLALRRRGVYFSLLTLAFTALGFTIAFRWTDLTGGESGLRGVKRVALVGVDLDSQIAYYYLCAVIVLAVARLLWRLVQSPFGAVLAAIRENEQRAAFLGYPVRRYKLAAFTLSTAVTALGGGLFTFLTLFASADPLHPNFSGEILAMSIVGGSGQFLGPALGAAFYILFREILSGYTASWLFWFGLLFMAFILFSPRGLIGLGQAVLAPFRKREEELAAMASRLTPNPSANWIPAQRRQTGDGRDDTLVAENIRKKFGDFTALDGVTIRIEHGRLQALIGPNGAGKTTLFNVLSGLYPPEHGRLAFAGVELQGKAADRFAALGIARSFQVTNLFQGLTVFENIRLGVQARHPDRFHMFHAKEEFEDINLETKELIRFLGLEGVEAAPVSSLSYGGQRLMEIGLALTARPRLLLLDEPLAGLAAAERERVVAMIRTLARHMGVLLVEHDIDRVFGFAERITAMANGRVLVEGTASEVRADRQVQEVYLGTGRRLGPGPRRGDEMAGEVLLSLDRINTYYGKSHILHDVSLEVREGQVTALLGRNGAGKSSTIKSIMGLVAPASGRVTFAGADIAGDTPERIARAGIGLVPQGRRLFPGLTVAENLKLGAHSRAKGAGVHWDAERIFGYFPKLRDKMNVKADLLSGGEQQMVAIARALSGNVKLLLLDEPFEGLAPAVVEEVFKALDQLRRAIAILIIEHDLDLVLALSDYAYVLDRGHVSHAGPAEPLLTDLEFRRKVLWV